MKQIALSLFVVAASGAYVWDQAGKRPADDVLGSVLPADAAEAPAAKPAEPALARVAPIFQIQPEPFGSQVTTRLPNTRETTAGVGVVAERPNGPVMQTVDPATSLPPSAPPKQAAALVVNAPAQKAPSFAVTPAVYIPIPQPRPAYTDGSARVVRVGMKLAVQGYADGVYIGPAADAYYGIIQVQALVKGGQLTALKVLKYPSDRRTSISINRQALPMLRDEAISAQSANVDIISGATLTSRAFIQSLRGALKKASS
ncbi:FMN-binding protein [Mesorhizobium sp. B2-6-4]|uniref:FMN-binding protein n=1 Tax=Mesorhizobium sp. B2-6-4 TaxID=2589913 RepID=UPI00112E73FF|nr:FMN-binding protein [Mesorhizobium sp. B2-6-4]TPJ54763.1 FMN-binding protein [Mesorhizobium sp. B2-6-4]